MTVTREDILRELELLPVWRARQPMPATHDAPQPEAPAPEIEKQETTPHIENATQAPVEVERTAIDWVLLYQANASQPQAAQALVQNIANAMRLSPSDVVLLTDHEQLKQYQAKTVVLFGQAMTDALLGESSQPISTLRGKSATYPRVSEANVWVTEGITEMLADASLKKQVWQDLQAAMASFSVTS